MVKILLPLFIFICVLLAIRLYSPNEKKLPIALPLPQYAAWIPGWDQDRAFDSLTNAGRKINIISPVWYSLDQKDQIKVDENIDRQKFKAKITDLGIKLLPSIFNHSDGERISKLVNNPSLSTELIEKLIGIAKTENYHGWDIDFEEIKPADRENFTIFIDNLGEKLHQNDLLLSVSVHVQTGKKSDRKEALAQEWDKISSAADYMRIMAYDFHNNQTPPGPVTPLEIYQLVLEKAKKVIPLEKIVIGLPLYGYDWGKTKASPVDFLNTQNLTVKLNRELIRDKNSGALTLNYFDKEVSHTVWLEDAQSTIIKINRARELGIYQFCFWRLGGEDPNLWTTLP